MQRVIWFIAFIVALMVMIPYLVAAWVELPIDDEFRSLAPGQFAPLTDGNTHYRWLGDESGEVVVLVHGVTVPSYIFAQAAAALTKSGYRVLLFDQFGHGYSDRPTARYDIDFFDRQMLELFDYLELVEPFNLGALSMGAIIAAELKSGETLQGDPSLQANHRGFLMAIRQIFRFLPFHHQDDIFARIDLTAVPVLGIFGDADDTINLTSADLLRNIIPRARIEVLAGGTHHLNIHRWQEVHSIVLSFLRNNGRVTHGEPHELPETG